jgi:hypothetical protein
MKDLTEALLIEMERRADALVEDLDHYADDMKVQQLKDAWQAIAQDVSILCAQLRAKQEAKPCAPSK